MINYKYPLHHYMIMPTYKHTLVNLPTELIKKIDQVKEDYSRDGFVRMAVRKEIRKHETKNKKQNRQHTTL
jgi:metal-responsive CopG/Arc/MetJ family transcriptional regulator